MPDAPVQFTPPVPFDEQQPPAIPHDILPGIISQYAAPVAETDQFTLGMIGEILAHNNTTTAKSYAQFLPDAAEYLGVKRDTATILRGGNHD